MILQVTDRKRVQNCLSKHTSSIQLHTVRETPLSDHHTNDKKQETLSLRLPQFKKNNISKSNSITDLLNNTNPLVGNRKEVVIVKDSATTYLGMPQIYKQINLVFVRAMFGITSMLIT